jgi:hypothetical protein
MSEAIIGTLLGVTLGAVLGWGLSEGTGVLRRRKQSNKVIRRFEHEIIGILIQAEWADEKLSTGLPRRPLSYTENLPSIETFGEVSDALPYEDMDFAAPAVHHWNAIRRAEPDTIPDIRGLKRLRSLLAYRTLLRKPFAWICSPRKCREYRRKIREIVSPSPESESELEKM